MAADAAAVLEEALTEAALAAEDAEAASAEATAVLADRITEDSEDRISAADPRAPRSIITIIIGGEVPVITEAAAVWAHFLRR